jgi:sulfur-oxidizing protein SoxY
MTDTNARPALDRRKILCAMAGTGLATLLPGASSALAQTPPPAPEPAAWELELKKVIGDAKPTEGKLVLDLPEIAENGNMVPLTVSVDSPMTDKEFVKAIHLFSTGNPQPMVATFYFSPLSGKAFVASRMRLAQTQDVISVAEFADGQFAMVRRNVKVTIGGCGG